MTSPDKMTLQIKPLFQDGITAFGSSPLQAQQKSKTKSERF